MGKETVRRKSQSRTDSKADPAQTSPNPRFNYRPPAGLPLSPRNTYSKPGARPASPLLAPGIRRIEQTALPDQIWIDSIKWDNLLPLDVSFRVPVEPNGTTLLNYHLSKGVRQ